MYQNGTWTANNLDLNVTHQNKTSPWSQPWHKQFHISALTFEARQGPTLLTVNLTFYNLQSADTTVAFALKCQSASGQPHYTLPSANACGMVTVDTTNLTQDILYW